MIKEHIAKSNLVITTALIPGKPAPILIPEDMVSGMVPGSAIMDLAAENGGNCELTKPGEIVNINNVIIDGRTNIPATMPYHASLLYGKNVSSFITYFCKDGNLELNMEDEIISGAMFTHDGKIVDERTMEAMKS